MRNARSDPGRLREGRKQAVAAILVIATDADADAALLEAAGDHVGCKRRQDAALRARRLAVQVGGPVS